MLEIENENENERWIVFDPKQKKKTKLKKWIVLWGSIVAATCVLEGW